MNRKNPREKAEAIIKGLKSSPEFPSKPKKKLIKKTEFLKLANEVKKIFEEEKREQQFSSTNL